MKNLKRTLLAFAMLFVVVLTTACSGSKTATKTFVRENNGVKTTLTYTYNESDDKVIKQTTVNEGVYANIPNLKTKEAVKAVLDPIAEKYQGIKGIKESIDYQEDKFVETLEVDYENLEYEKAKTIMGESFQDPKKVKISMKKSEELVTQQGFKEQK